MIRGETFRRHIAASGKSIYDEIERYDPQLWIPTEELQSLLSPWLTGLSLVGLPLRTRSKVVKSRVAEALGYPTPDSFRRVKPRFPGQDLDVYTQKSNNLQIWNDEVAPKRRYAIIQIDSYDTIQSVRVVLGDQLAKLDRTGALTHKYQARVDPGQPRAELLTPYDTDPLRALGLVREPEARYLVTPTLPPSVDALMPIEEVFARLQPILELQVAHRGATQERNRGSEIHRAVCNALGYTVYRDYGQFPDIRHQLLEVKLQTSPTIDLGLVLPSSVDRLDIPPLGYHAVRHCDVRYAVICGEFSGSHVRVTHVFLSTGEDFLNHFSQFGGKIINSKLQIPLPADFFD